MVRCQLLRGRVNSAAEYAHNERINAMFPSAKEIAKLAAKLASIAFRARQRAEDDELTRRLAEDDIPF